MGILKNKLTSKKPSKMSLTISISALTASDATSARSNSISTQPCFKSIGNQTKLQKATQAAKERKTVQLAQKLQKDEHDAFQKNVLSEHLRTTSVSTMAVRNAQATLPMVKKTI